MITTIGFGAAFSVAAIYYIFYLLNSFYAHAFLTRPIVVCPIMGILLGKPEVGILLGAQLEGLYMGISSLPSDVFIGGTVITGLVCLGAMDMDVAASFTTLIAIVGAMASLAVRLCITGPFSHWLERFAKRGEGSRYRKYAIGYNFFLPLPNTIIIFIAVFYGGGILEELLNAIPVAVRTGLSVAAGILPAIGLGMMINALGAKRTWLYVIAGFLLASIPEINSLLILAFALTIAGVELFVRLDQLRKKQVEEAPPSPTWVQPEEATAPPPSPYEADWDGPTFRRVFFSYTSMASICFSQSKMMNVGFTIGLLPWLKKLYPEKGDGYAAALTRHQSFFNCTPETAFFILGLSCALEGQYRDHPAYDTRAVTGLKASLMMPLSGMGDAAFWVALRTVAATVALSLAQDGNLFAPFAFLLIFHGISFPFRWFSLKLGFLVGKKGAAIYRGEQWQLVLGFCITMGSIMLGVMGANFLNLETPISLNGDNHYESRMLLQDSLNAIFPKFLPFVVLVATTLFLKKWKKPMVLIALFLAIAILGVSLGVLGRPPVVDYWDVSNPYDPHVKPLENPYPCYCN
ncbi:PTS system mannose/fructose/sorbose family transporter subunit IID [Eubacteriales bacterium OttesenSCG-928-M02]|nr:PTS system mannose/fructose/sorbose family transporter subunit IID [Eubacteriales bacterium OttesenSCG-928-M02]